VIRVLSALAIPCQGRGKSSNLMPKILQSRPLPDRCCRWRARA